MNDGELDASPSAESGGDAHFPHPPQASATGPIEPFPDPAHAEVIALLSSLPQPVIPADISARIDAALAAEVISARNATDEFFADAEHAEVIALLAALPPASIPSDLAARIDAALAAEATSRDVKPRPSRTRLAFALAAAAAAILIVSKNPWVSPSGTVTAAGPTTSASDSTFTPSPRVASPAKTLIQVSRHAYHRSSLSTEVMAMANGQAAGVTVTATQVPARWRAVAKCAQQYLATRNASGTSKVDLGWFDTQASAVILSPGGTGAPASVTVLQEKSGACSVAATTRLTP